MSQPLVSVCVLAYDRPDGLRSTLECLAQQTYQAIEIIISDDCSPDPGVEAVATAFAKTDPRIKYFRQPNNLGIIENHRFLLGRAQGTYLMWACDDDGWHPDYIKLCVEALEANPKAVLSCTYTDMVDFPHPYFEYVDTVGMSCPKERFIKVFEEILWWNNSFYGLIRKSAIQSEDLKRIFAFDLCWVSLLSLKGEFIQLPHYYFKKKNGGHGNSLAENLRSIKVRKTLFHAQPGLHFALQMVGVILRRKSVLSVGNKAVIALHLLRRSIFLNAYGDAKGSVASLTEFLFLWPLRWYEKIKHVRRYPSTYIRQRLEAEAIPPEAVAYLPDTQELMLKPLGIKLKLPEQAGFLSQYYVMNTMVKHYDARFANATDSLISLSLGGVSFEMTQPNEATIIHEVLCEKVYSIHVPQKKTVVVDVGMNIGSTALYFATMSQVDKVIAFEPFAPTYQRALANFALNPAISEKIEAHNIGLGCESKTVHWDYHPDTADMAGLHGMPAHVSDTVRSDIRPLEVTIKPAHEVLRHALDQHPDHFLILKIDCEGCEYEVMDSLAEADMLGAFDVVMVEWHLGGCQRLLVCLEAHGFACFVAPKKGQEEKYGMLRAIRLA